MTDIHAIPVFLDLARHLYELLTEILAERLAGDVPPGVGVGLEGSDVAVEERAHVLGGGLRRVEARQLHRFQRVEARVVGLQVPNAAVAAKRT